MSYRGTLAPQVWRALAAQPTEERKIHAQELLGSIERVLASYRRLPVALRTPEVYNYMRQLEGDCALLEAVVNGYDTTSAPERA